ncbi:flagellar hook-associated protein FlgK [Dyella sp. A6]|uniref:flagellar hook-associated protein FlgK n=1 Tax=Dyella aluminiiresistens TaxID=3069105 RepID=UPI002E78012A|nr:flagellar hook-associated protein FlgK [Dyella sp. A6]
MSNMLAIGTSGLNAAQLALNTISNNISNSSTTGYSRESTVQTEQVGATIGNLTIGGGVNVTAVQRAYNQFLTTAMWTSNSGLQGSTTYNDLATTLNSTLSSSGNLQTSLDNFYTSFNTLAGSADSSSNRLAVLGSASSLASNFNTLAQQFDQQQSSINTQVAQTVDSINSTASSIAKLNQQIVQAGSGSSASNALLDQRDTLVNTLSGYLGVSTSFNTDGSINVFTNTGQSLVSGSNAYALSTGPNAYDATTTDVMDNTGTDITGKLSGGTLGALLTYRSNVLVPAQNQLGLAAVGLASSVNTQQSKGLDLNGQQGAAIFSVPSPGVSASSANQGSATVAASISDPSALTGSDYVLSYNGSQWNLATTAGQSVALTTNANGSLSAAGLTFNVSGTAQAGDSYKIEPTRNAASGISVSMTDPNGIAAAAALTTTASSSNTGSAAVSAITVTDPTHTNLLSSATVSFPTAGSYQVTDSSGNVLSSGSYSSGQAITANGWSLTLSGTPAAGDSFAVAANTSGLADNSNALSMAAMSGTGVLNSGKTSIVDAYANLTTQIGDAGSQASSDLTVQTALNNQAVSAQQSVSGVNLDQEASNMVQYQQAYQAAAHIISTAQTLFSSLLTAIQA